jgi:alpha-beta hydrolase superfamily lysophospholipase
VAQGLSLQDAPVAGPEPVVVSAPAGPLFGFYHPAEGHTVQGIGVVLCNPLGYEAMCAHRTYRHFAERLARRGFATLRFDYHGTGDSSGSADEPGRLQGWLDSIDAAVNELRERAGTRSIALFGVRFGATLAVAVAARRRDIDHLVLWAPSASGRAYVRELRAFRMMKDPRAAPSQRANGGEEVAGYHFAKATIADLSEVDLFTWRERVAARTLIVARDDLAGAEVRLAQHLEESGVDVRLSGEPGYARMMRDPQESVVPFAALDHMVDWLEEARCPGGPTAAAKSARRVLVTTAPRSRNQVREQYFCFGSDQRLFGIAAEPADTAARSGRPAIVFLNVGANHHVGPNRMYVSLARELAALGYLGFRFDVAGLGDSRHAPNTRENRLYSKDSVADVKAAMTFLGERYKAERFILVGLCSGAYLAFHTCIEDSRVAGQILLNPQTFEWKDGDSLDLSMRRSFLSTRYYARAILNPAVWRRVLSGDVNARGVMSILRERLMAQTNGHVARIASRVRGESEPRTEIENAFHAVCQRGVESLLVFSFSDGGIDMIEKHLGRNVGRMSRYKNLRFEIVDGADHTFTPIDAQAALHQLLSRHVTARFP